MVDASVRVFVAITRFYAIELRSPTDVAGVMSGGVCLADQMLGIYKNFVYSRVKDQAAVCDFRAVILFMRWIRTRNNSRWSSRISLPERISPSLHRIFFVSVCFGDCLSFNCLLFLPFTRYTAYARVGTVPALLRVKRCAEHKRSCQHRSESFQRFRFHTFLSFVRFRSQRLRRMFAAANSRK